MASGKARRRPANHLGLWLILMMSRRVHPAVLQIEAVGNRDITTLG
jgi:hypothetical protein